MKTNSIGNHRRWFIAGAIVMLFIGTCLAQPSNTKSSDIAMSQPLSRGTLIFNPTDDSYIGNPDEVNGHENYMALRNGSSGNQYIASPVLKFDISSVPPTTTIIYAKLYLFYYDIGDSDPVGRAETMRRFLGTWNEGTITHNNMPSYSSEISAVTSMPGSPGVWVSWNVTADVQKFISGALTNYGWIINDEHYWSGSYIPIAKFHSKEYGSSIPYLEIFVNDPPAVPQITGQASGKPGQTYDYTFVASDPNSNQLYYTIDWGDGQTNTWIGPYTSGQPLTLPHSWAKKGTYALKAKVKDTYNAESDWGTLQITMPLSNNLIRPYYLEQLFERFPHAFPILRHLLGF